jgi:hypothetical protein
MLNQAPTHANPNTFFHTGVGVRAAPRASAFLTALHRLFLPLFLGKATPEFLHPVLNHKSESKTTKERQRAGLAPQDPRPNIIDEV